MTVAEELFTDESVETIQRRVRRDIESGERVQRFRGLTERLKELNEACPQFDVPVWMQHQSSAFYDHVEQLRDCVDVESMERLQVSLIYSGLLDMIDPDNPPKTKVEAPANPTITNL